MPGASSLQVYPQDENPSLCDILHPPFTTTPSGVGKIRPWELSVPAGEKVKPSNELPHLQFQKQTFTQTSCENDIVIDFKMT